MKIMIWFKQIVWMGFVLCFLAACQAAEPTASVDPALDLPSEVATLTHAAVSPSGTYQLMVVAQDNESGKLLSFQIATQDGTVVYSSSDQYSTRHKTYFLWDFEDRVWVYAGDEGTFFWENTSGTWNKTNAADSKVQPPAFIEKARSQQH